MIISEGYDKKIENLLDNFIEKYLIPELSNFEIKESKLPKRLKNIKKIETEKKKVKEYKRKEKNKIKNSNSQNIELIRDINKKISKNTEIGNYLRLINKEEIRIKKFYKELEKSEYERNKEYKRIVNMYTRNLKDLINLIENETINNINQKRIYKGLEDHLKDKENNIIVNKIHKDILYKISSLTKIDQKILEKMNVIDYVFLLLSDFYCSGFKDEESLEKNLINENIIQKDLWMEYFKAFNQAYYKFKNDLSRKNQKNIYIHCKKIPLN